MKMKPQIRCFVLCVAWALFSANAYARGFIAIGGGAGGEAEASNVSFELGGKSDARDVNTFGAIAIGIILNGDSVPSDTLDYPVPHYDYTSLGTRQDGSEIATVIKYGVEIKKGSGVFFYGLGGLSFAKEIELARSNVTGWYYEQSSTYNYYGVYGGGVCYFPKNQNISLHVDVDNRRGITGSIGCVF